MNCNPVFKYIPRRIYVFKDSGLNPLRSNEIIQVSSRSDRRGCFHLECVSVNESFDTVARILIGIQRHC